MAGRHRSHERTNGIKKRSKGAHRVEPRHEPYSWMGAAAVTLGMGAALASGSAVAHADDSGTGGGAAGGASSSSGASGASGSSSDSSGGAGSPQHHRHAPKSSIESSSGGNVSGTTKTTSATTKTTESSSTPSEKSPTPSVDQDSTTGSTTQAASTADSTPSHGNAVTHAVQHAVTALAERHTVIDHGSPDTAAKSSAPDTGSTSAVTAAVTPHLAAFSSPTPKVVPAVAVIPAAATPVAPPLPGNLIVGVLTEVFSGVNTLIAPNPAVPPADPVHLLVFEVVRRIETTLGLPVVGTPVVTTSDPVIGNNPVSTAPGVPSPTDAVQTPYGDIGKWLLQPNGQISDFGGATLGGKTLLEPINVIILDPTSTTSAESAAKLNADLAAAGFPAQPVHTTGFQANLNGETVSQQPTGLLDAYSDNSFLIPDDHARAFGTGPTQDYTGYVWTVAASREQFGLSGLLPTHTYVSYDEARDALASQLILSGATLVGIVPLSNAYNTDTVTTGDNDGYAIVIQLNN
jgi:hypothetical protein